MRSDMAKVLVERPRMRRPARGQGSPYPRAALAHRYERALEDVPSKLGMAAGHREKWLNENLAPLRRFLRAQVGRPWDAVFREISAQVRVTSAVQAHIKQHLFDYVIRTVYTIGGVLHGATTCGLWPFDGHHFRDILYVCPRTGNLRLCPSKPVARERIGRVIHLDTRHELREIDGTWKHVTLARIPPRLAPGTLFDVLLDDYLDPTWLGEANPRYQRLFGRTHAYAIAIRPPGRRESARIASFVAKGRR